MRRILTPCVVAMAVVTLGAQAGPSKSKPDQAKVLTITGCLRGGPAVFVLTNALAAGPAEKDKGAVGIADAYSLVPGAGVTLAPHVGRRVELVGSVVDAAKGDETAKPKIPGVPTAQFAVTSVKMISPVCIE